MCYLLHEFNFINISNNQITLTEYYFNLSESNSFIFNEYNINELTNYIYNDSEIYNYERLKDSVNDFIMTAYDIHYNL